MSIPFLTKIIKNLTSFFISFVKLIADILYIYNDYFGKVKPLEALECFCDSVSVALPVRINLSGTWTDALPYCTDNGGSVIKTSVLSFKRTIRMPAATASTTVVIMLASIP